MSAPSPGRKPLLPRVLDALGRTLIGAGLLLLAFVAYQLWGTGIQQSRSQKALEKQYESRYPVRAPSSTTATTVPTTATTAVPKMPATGEVIGRIAIPRLGLNTWFVAGARLAQLEKGPGLFLGSVLPGQFGNAAVAGHRTSYGAPFGDLDKLAVGDQIVYTTPQGTFTYIVGSSEIVDAGRVDVVETKDRTRAVTTLVTCHPKWTSSKRLIVRAELASSQAPMPPTPLVTAPGTASDVEEAVSPGWFHDTSRIAPTVLWSLLLVAVWIAGRRLAGTGWRRVAVTVVSGAAFLSVLFMVFENLTGLLPANL